MPYALCYTAWTTNILPDTAFDPHFVTGQAKAQIILAKYAKWRLLTTNAAKPKGHTLAPIFSTSDAH
ncbi:hypothetical protein D3C79_897410 [compost metagenome]